MITTAQIKAFVEQVRASGSVNFPVVARAMHMDWYRDLHPLLEDKQSALFVGLSEALMSIKYELIERINRCALEGTYKGGRVYEPKYAREMIKLIDSGALLGEMKNRDEEKEEEEPEKEEPKPEEPKMSDEEFARHLRRLNLASEKD